MKKVLQFKITLKDIEPAIWRRIQVSDQYTFHQLHCAIQDAMGWMDCHLHEFHIKDTNLENDNKPPVRIGVLFKDEEPFIEDIPILDDEEIKVVNYLNDKEIVYIYDFGDHWEHLIEFEGEFSKSDDTPVCLEGMNACPPEDVGGYPSYPNFLNAMKDKKHQDHEMYVNWIGLKTFDPNKFDANKVKFNLSNSLV